MKIEVIDCPAIRIAANARTPIRFGANVSDVMMITPITPLNQSQAGSRSASADPADRLAGRKREPDKDDDGDDRLERRRFERADAPAERRVDRRLERRRNAGDCREQERSAVTRHLRARIVTGQDGIRVARETYTASEAARALGISLDTLRRWDRAGRIKTERDSANRRLVPAAEIARLKGDAPEQLSARNHFRGVDQIGSGRGPAGAGRDRRDRADPLRRDHHAGRRRRARARGGRRSSRGRQGDVRDDRALARPPARQSLDPPSRGPRSGSELTQRVINC